MLYNLVNFLFAMKLSSDFFYNIQISTTYEKIILKFIVISIALDRLGSSFLVIREVTHIKIIILESNLEFVKGLLVLLIYYYVCER